MKKFYKREEVMTITGVSETTLDRWSRKLRETHMVTKPKGSHILFSIDFVVFIQNRVEAQGPANLPAPATIAKLYLAYRVCKGSVSCIAKRLKKNMIVTTSLLTSVGLLKEGLDAS